jgi:hypothetical protein
MTLVLIFSGSGRALEAAPLPEEPSVEPADVDRQTGDAPLAATAQPEARDDSAAAPPVCLSAPPPQAEREAALVALTGMVATPKDGGYRYTHPATG